MPTIIQIGVCATFSCSNNSTDIFFKLGTQQPGCGTDITGQCGHSLVRDFFAESINPAQVFGAIRCRNLDDIRQRNCVVSGTSRRMGGEPIMDAPSEPGSVYFLTTNGQTPFAHGPR